MSKPHDFNYFFGLAIERSNRAAAAVRKLHESRPFESREEIRAAYRRELRYAEAGAITQDDEYELGQLGISI
jgi:hypothetical protein